MEEEGVLSEGSYAQEGVIYTLYPPLRQQVEEEGVLSEGSYVQEGVIYTLYPPLRQQVEEEGGGCTA